MGEELRLVMPFLRKLFLMWEAHKWSRKARRMLDVCPSSAEWAMGRAAELMNRI